MVKIFHAEIMRAKSHHPSLRHSARLTRPSIRVNPFICCFFNNLEWMGINWLCTAEDSAALHIFLRQDAPSALYRAARSRSPASPHPFRLVENHSRTTTSIATCNHRFYCQCAPIMHCLWYCQSVILHLSAFP